MKWNRNSLRSYHLVINTVCIQFSFDVRDWDISDITLTGLDTLVKSNSRVYHKVEENILRCSWIKTFQAASENEYFVVVQIRLVSFPFVFVFLLYVSLEHVVFFWTLNLQFGYRGREKGAEGEKLRKGSSPLFVLFHMFFARFPFRSSSLTKIY